MKSKILSAISALFALLILTACMAEYPAQPSATDAEVQQTIQQTQPVNAQQEESDPQPTQTEAAELKSGTTPLMKVEFAAQTHPESEREKEYWSSMTEKAEFTGTAKVADDVIKALSSAMTSGSRDAIPAGMTCGRELSEDEFYAMTGESSGSIEGSFVAAIAADADNDGAEDAVALISYGGSGGFCSMRFYRGGYGLTGAIECNLQDFYVVSSGGVNYVVMSCFDYDTKYFSGFSIYRFDGGLPADCVQLSYALDGYDMKVAFREDSFSGIDKIEKTLCNKKMPSVLAYNDGVIYGTAETVLEDGYRADIDNDGDEESFTKAMWIPSNTGTVKHCVYTFDGDDDAQRLIDKLVESVGESDGGELYTFWLDEVSGVNVLYLYYGRDLDFTLYAYIILL